MFNKRKEQKALEAEKERIEAEKKARLEDELKWVQDELITARFDEKLDRYSDLIDLQLTLEQTIAYVKATTISEQMESCLNDMERARIKEDYNTYRLLSEALLKLAQAQEACSKSENANGTSLLLEIGGSALCTIIGGILQNKLVSSIINAEKDHVFRTQAWSFIPTKLKDITNLKFK